MNRKIRNEFLPASWREFRDALASLFIYAAMTGFIFLAWGLWL